MRFRVCKKEYWYFACIDLYIELLILLNCEYIGRCRPCTYILKWIIQVLSKRFLDFESTLILALSLKSFVSEPYIVSYYKIRMKYINDFCKKVKSCGWWDDYHLELLSFGDFFEGGNDEYLFLRRFILSYFLNSNDFYHVNEFASDDLFSCLACV